MSAAERIVLSIDDNKIVHRFVDKALSDYFVCQHAFRGEEGIELAKSNDPAVILLDVDMPGMNGYEVCDKLKHTPETADIPVVFLSARGDLRDRMQGYEVGGADYIVKPFVEADLVAKTNVLIQIREKQQLLQAKYAEAQKTAYTAMSGSNELGQVMHFVEKSYSTNDYQTLAKLLCEVTRGFGLNTTIVIDTNEGQEWFSSSGAINPLESNVIGLLREKSRFQDFGCRTQINFTHIALLVKNMPLDDMERYGRIKDWLPALLGAADARIATLNTEKALIEQSAQINSAIQTIKGTLDQLSTSLTQNQSKGTSVLREMFDELNVNLPHMGLEEDQEEYILERIDLATQQAMLLVDAGQDINAAFTMVLSDLEQLATKQNELLSTVIAQDKNPTTDDDNDDNIMSVELF